MVKTRFFCYDTFKNVERRKDMKKQLKRKSMQILSIMISVIVLLSVAMAIYVSDGYEALAVAESALQSDEYVTVEQIEGAIIFMPKEAEEGLIFYPGGKVAHDAYAPFMHAFAKAGVACILVEMPFDLAIFDKK